MFDNLFGLAGPVGTASALFALLLTVGVAVSISFVSRAGQATARRYRSRV